MTTWYESDVTRISALEHSLLSRSIRVRRVELGTEIVGLACSCGAVSTDLEILRQEDTEIVFIIRHEGVHLVHPIRFWRLQKAIVDSLVEIKANRMD